MGCGCTGTNPVTQPTVSPEVEPPLVLVEDHQTAEAGADCGTPPAWVEAPCAGDQLASNQSSGATLPASMTNARCATEDEGVTLLGRVGNTLAKFTGSGFLQLRSGKAYLVKAIPVGIRQLWHRWVRGATTPVLADPHPFPYGVVADRYGNLYGIQGLATADSVRVWNATTRQHETWPLSALPLQVQAPLTPSDHLEIVGFEEVGLLGTPSAVRCLKALAGVGIVYLEQVPVNTDSECAESAFAYVAKVLAFPEITQDLQAAEVSRHRLVYSSHGLYWEAEGEVLDGALGND